ncbi:threonyl-tRNA synthetase [Enteropsectra breve]|nr:threonyl-tRNA synthetase [Enteropsectra breve]
MSCSEVKVLVEDKEYAVESGTAVIKFIKDSIENYKDAIACRIDGTVADLSTKIEKSCKIDLLKFEDADGKEVFWHSSAHVLGQALTNLYPCKLVNGPPVDEGFYYDIEVSTPISTDDFEKIEKEVQKIVKANMKFERVEKSKEELLEMYEDNKYKQYFIEKNVVDRTTVYYNDKFYDMCLGPHLLGTGAVKVMKLLKTSSVYFLNDPNNASLQRIYAVSFPNKAMMKEYEERVKRAMEMDHRKVGKELDLFFFHKYSPGSGFWLPAGAHIYNKLQNFIREEYRKRGFREVITPNIFSNDLWKESGHYDNYKDDIYMIEKEDFALKPMNCPGHCLMFKHSERSFKELPVRFADFGVLHRNECSGSLSGLTRVRRFQQDDAHIFCRRDQIKSEIVGCIDFLSYVYKIFNFKFELFLSTRPEKYLGELEEWEEAENALAQGITEASLKYTINPGDGAFYGPKIDIILTDAFNRKIQCATIQLDFQLPQRFGLKYTATDGSSQSPVIIHRAIFGSLERMIAILIESYGKKLPFWLTPYQIAIVPLYADEYAQEIKEKLSEYEVKVYDDTKWTFNKRIRNALIDGYSLVCVVGKKEAEIREINIRLSEKESHSVSVEKFEEIVREMRDKKREIGDIFKKEDNIDLEKLKI